jgi:hypothetical protein
MKIHIVCYEDVNSWIIGKFALRMNENLRKMNIDSNISDTPDPTADINHHLIYNSFIKKRTTLDTLMITHVDSTYKFNLLQDGMKIASAGICMSKETMNYLVKMGIDKTKICYINPAHDGNMPMRKIVIGIASRIYSDGRKNEFYLDKLSKKLNPTFFKIRIMGAGWELQVENLLRCNFEVDYIDHFNYQEYLKFIPSLDYYLYTGFDEGQIGFIDALSAGVKTIAAPQGYHLDATGGISYPFTNYTELENILLNLQNEKHCLTKSVALWNWYDYTLKHVEVWRYLLGENEIKSKYIDGLNTLISSMPVIPLNKYKLFGEKVKLNKWQNFHQRKQRIEKIKQIVKKDGIFHLFCFLLSRIRRVFSSSL